MTFNNTADQQAADNKIREDHAKMEAEKKAAADKKPTA